MTCLVVGGSAGVGRAIAERFAAAGEPLVILSSDLRDAGAVASDLSLRYRVSTEAVALDLRSGDLDLRYLDVALDRLPALHGLLLAAGRSSANDRPGQGHSGHEAITRVNYSSLCRVIDHCLPRLCTAGSEGFVVGFGSVAAERGRTNNAAYAAAKRALRSYFESLRHALGPHGIVVQFYTLGYIDTNLAFGHKTIVPKASPHRLADTVYRRRRRDFGHAFYPAFWRPACFMLRAMPWSLFRRMSF